MKAAAVIAGQEIANGVRNLWVAGAVAMMLVFSLALALVGSAPGGATAAGGFVVLIVNLAGLSVFLVPLMALLLAHDAIVGEAERGTLALTLSYPLGRGAFLLGKFLGHLAIVLIAIFAGFGLAAFAVADGSFDVGGFALLVGSAVLLGAIFLALGYAVSALVRERASAAGMAIGLWVYFVIVHDLALLGLLVTVGERLPDGLVTALLLANPADVFRLVNLTGSEAAMLASGMDPVAIAIDLSRSMAIGSLLAWLAGGLLLAWFLFRRKEV